MGYLLVFLIGVLIGAGGLGYLWYRYHVVASGKIANLQAAARMAASVVAPPAIWRSRRARTWSTS